MKHIEMLDKASSEISTLTNHTIDSISINKPTTRELEVFLAKNISKLSPLISNLIEYHIVAELNNLQWSQPGKWIRQDPGFPDILFQGTMNPNPGIEIKTWFPLATEITARFRDSITNYRNNQTNVAVVAWLPEFIIYGKPKIIDIWNGSAKSLALHRDRHYFNPPDYIILEPEDTSARTRNLQQTNANGYKFQGSSDQLSRAHKATEDWNIDTGKYKVTADNQEKMRRLFGKFPYRLDTNFGKIDRIEHPGLEEFKRSVLDTEIMGHKISSWAKAAKSSDSIIRIMRTKAT